MRIYGRVSILTNTKLKGTLFLGPLQNQASKTGWVIFLLGGRGEGDALVGEIKVCFKGRKI